MISLLCSLADEADERKWTSVGASFQSLKAQVALPHPQLKDTAKILISILDWILFAFSNQSL